MAGKIYDFDADQKEFNKIVKLIMLGFVLGTTAIMVVGTYLIFN